MKKLIHLFILLSTLSFGQVRADCFDVVKNILMPKKSLYGEMPEYELLKKIESLENVTNLLRRKKENPDPAIDIKVGIKLAELDSFLMNNQWGAAHREVRKLFREVEFAYLIAEKKAPLYRELSLIGDNLTATELKDILKKQNINENFSQMLLKEFQKAGSGKKFVKGIRRDLNQKLVTIGSEYHRYKMVREHLEELLKNENCDTGCQKNVEKLLSKVGIESDQERLRFPGIIGDARRFSMDELSHVLNSNPLALLTRLKKERNAELFSLIRDFFLQPELVDQLFKTVYNLPGINKSRVVRLFKMIYNQQARTLHFPKINKIVRSRKNISEKFYFLKELNSSIEGDEFLVTFSRRVDEQASTTWKEFQEYAKVNDAEFFKRMEKAKVKAVARGDISLVYKRSFVSKLASLIIAGGGVSYYFYFDQSETALVGTSEEVTGELGKEVIEIDGDQEKLIEDVSKVVLHENGKRDPSSVGGWWNRVLNFFLRITS